MSADKSYQMTPIGNEVARYLRTKRMRLTDSSYHSYEFCLEKFVRHCEDLQPEDFEPPAGMQRLKECLEDAVGHRGTAHLQQKPVDHQGLLPLAGQTGTPHR